LVIVTEAPGTTAPLESVIVPKIDPSVPVCAEVDSENNNRNVTGAASSLIMVSSQEVARRLRLMHPNGTVKATCPRH
jgi:hypothetical protein